LIKRKDSWKFLASIFLHVRGGDLNRYASTTRFISINFEINAVDRNRRAETQAARNVSSNDRRRAVTPNYDAIIEETSQPIDIGSTDLCRSADGVTTIAESMVKVRHWDSATSIHPNRQNLHLEEHAVRGTRNKSSMRSPRAPHTTRAART
jgi:hypothetical protein